MKTYMFVGGTLESFVKFRLGWIEQILNAETDCRIVNLYFGNADGVCTPELDPERCLWIDLKGNHAGPMFFDTLPVAKLLWHIIAFAPEYLIAFNAKPIFFIGLLGRFRLYWGHSVALLEGLGLGFAFLKSDSWPARIKQYLVRFSTRFFHKWIFLNSHDERLFRDKKMLGVHARHLTTNGVGIDLGHYTNADSLEANWSKQAVGFSGRLIEEKGLQIVAEVAQIVKTKMPGIQFYIAGRSTPHPSNIGQHKLDDWVKADLFESIKYYDDSKEFYRKISLVILPTVYNEGLPAVAMEGQAMGLPILLNKIPQTEAALDHGITGFLIDENNPQHYADIIMRLMADKKTYTEIARNCRPFSEVEFNRLQINRTYIDFIEARRIAARASGWRSRHPA